MQYNIMVHEVVYSYIIAAPFIASMHDNIYKITLTNVNTNDIKVLLSAIKQS